VLRVGRESLHPALVWICGEDGTPFGAGLLVRPRQVLTCAHVVATALGLATTADRPPEGTVGIRFTHADDAAVRRAKPSAGRWFPPGAGGDGDPGAGDIALLDLTDEPPAQAHPISTFRSGAAPGYAVHAFGLPAGHTQQNGGWAAGDLAGAQASGWIQIDSPAAGYRIQPGFSGAAAWSDAHDAVVGMIVASESSTDVRVAWMIPSARIGECIPEITVADAGAPSAEVSAGPRVVKVTNSPAPPEPNLFDGDEALGIAMAEWVMDWFSSAKIVVNLGADEGVTVGDYFDVLAKHEAVEDDAGNVLGFVDQPGSLIRAVEIDRKFSVCQLESFAYATFYEFVLPARLKAHGLAGDDDAELSPELFAELQAPVAVGDTIKPIPPAEKDARDEVEDLYGRSIDDDLPASEKEEIYREMVRRADRFLARFPSGYFAGPVLYHKGYALINAGSYSEALDTFTLYNRQYPFGSTDGAEHYIAEAKAALRGEPQD
jgi:Trypsin-like peptidase domain